MRLSCTKLDLAMVILLFTLGNVRATPPFSNTVSHALRARGDPSPSSAHKTSDFSTIAPADTPAMPSCVAVPSDDVRDAHERELKKAADYFCKQFTDDLVTDPGVEHTETIISAPQPIGRGVMDLAKPYEGEEPTDDVYEFSVESVDRCSPNGGYNIAEPVADHKCVDILHDAWKGCTSSSNLYPSSSD